ncbi:1-(5-phosphoribosyl)-5-[(5-phosphoribosylamino)methylideneamino]imidazole-4-carboxamide isomerase [Umezakia ovalisporum]|jgi:phosphoribosylformimino-5-aminoimidazole carboxamide ribotide isomerase|uniref:1-(5-phosphoribosyl)-5-[(5-phosphoribosylamino)methylideneamino] imidazole-4-carboxamide isomerase n=2 Tax=Umezakia ovalisporum TaxID=75695 RepID=A0AA43GWR7_9CYAN|nr:1-(5-phosphoribosyl)-5-[(5-phosphoribosylamino)methylideneamino]imidazole-4-carboxamide isomerase [Umezakia ovalisporum]MBI1241289.1 1-(5-phosphoribosyl)-5-[(5-phosphoribosylamino)methylideneamino]imidazole-4-carboxamide isomerase [Nostoc sp. RI_552]MDH6055337.1 1-(5-phosphoribosyl)-5-[(5-phosphoribosylamino)methylideneamino]imidazole-4-carboxamide isomerase [Umezakia ovalisporum FSS-43]MDH6062642.1 1-(5-phosphoribosyl)-5-[(5-phosphoribosylamino)methylideneamino]imidazole-4-carboxamide isomer
MDVIPAIDLLEGRCVRLYQGDYQRSQVFSEKPVDIAKQWVDQGATRLHLVDLDGAKAGKVVNLNAIEAIAEAVPVPIEVGGGLRHPTSIEQVFNLGVQWAILGTIAVEKPELVQELCQEFPGRIIIGIDARNGLVATRGWLETSEVLATQLALEMQELGAAAIIYTDIHRDGTLIGPNLEALRQLAAKISIPIIASGGVSSVSDLLSLLALEMQGVTGVIVGRALYTGDIALREALRAIGPGRIQDIPPNVDSTFA